MSDEVRAIAPELAQLTNVVFGDLWRGTDLTVRDRSLVTIAALAAMGDDVQLDGYVRRGLESGLTRAQIARPGIDPSGLLRGLGEGDQRVDSPHEDSGQVVEHIARLDLAAFHPPALLAGAGSDAAIRAG